VRTSSAKAKGRRACQELREALYKYYPMLEDGDIFVTPSGCTGEDLKLSPKAQRVLPFTFEVKNQESIQIWKAIEQAKTHAEGTVLTPILAFKRNRTDLHVCLSLIDFLNLLSSKRDEFPNMGNDSSSVIALDKHS
jgi:hypothetical protein